VAFSSREEGSLPPVLPSKMRITTYLSCATSTWSLAREASSTGALPTGRTWANLGLGFKQCSLHPTMQVLRTYGFLRLLSVFRFSAMLWSPLPFDVR
jgi:hypothetical protein